jgi:hypothetical protein
MDEAVYDFMKRQFYMRTSPYTHGDVEFIRLEPEFRGEIYGSTAQLFKNSLQKELIVQD